MGPGLMGSGGTEWVTGVFRSNGERIYFTGTSKRNPNITYSGGPRVNEWMMMGGKHTMGMMQEMHAKDIRWSVLQSEFDAEKFRLAVVEGQDPDGTQLNPEMPRWSMSYDDLADVIAFLKTLP